MALDLLVNHQSKLQVVDGNQYKRSFANRAGNFVQLCKARKGLREFVYFRLDLPNGEMKFYVEEQSVSGMLSYIDNDEEWEEIASFMDAYVNRIGGGGSSVG